MSRIPLTELRKKKKFYMLTDLLLNAGYMGTVLVIRTASYFLSIVEDNSVNEEKRNIVKTTPGVVRL